MVIATKKIYDDVSISGTKLCDRAIQHFLSSSPANNTSQSKILNGYFSFFNLQRSIYRSSHPNAFAFFLEPLIALLNSLSWTRGPTVVEIPLDIFSANTFKYSQISADQKQGLAIGKQRDVLRGGWSILKNEK